MKKGKLIVFEGGEGSGKGTQIELLKRDFPDFIYTREPGGSDGAEKLRSILKENILMPSAALLGFYSAREDHIKKIILPAIKNGKTVICDRFELSTFAYQNIIEKDLELFEYLHGRISKLIPNIQYIYFDIDPIIGLERVNSRENGDLAGFDAESLDFHNNVRKRYLDGIEKYFPKTEIVDASRSIKEIYFNLKKYFCRKTTK